MIPYGKHVIDEQDVEAVVDVLRNQFLTQGTVVPKFEQALCNYTGCQHAVAVNSATSGLHVACMAAGVCQDDIVWTVPNSFVASANCALYCGACIDFVDIDATTRNIDVTALTEKLVHAAKSNQLPKALIVVHFSGVSCDMQAIQVLTKQYSIVLIEDAAHALGGSYQGQKIGSCNYSDIAVLSFHPVKSITSAEGGAVLTNNHEYWQKSVLFAKHGTTRDTQQMVGESHGPWYYQQVALGYNYRLSDLHAALGLSQLGKLDGFIQKRTELALNYQARLADLPLKLPEFNPHSNSAWHLYMVEVTQHDRKQVYEQLHKKGIGVNVHYIPIHLQPFYSQLGFKQGDYPVAESFYNQALTLPLYPGLSNDQQNEVVQALRDVLL
jgi:UDP-4-amino-4,6-dideoxy-N-acetyl-beta-L-altrosamine transaminase